MACNNNISNLCIDSISSDCVDYKGKLSDNTTITEECVNQSDVNEDLYKITDQIIEKQDTSDLGDSCINYPITDGKITLKSVLETNEQEICNLKDKVTDLEQTDFANLDITGFNLNFECLADPCGDPITTLGQLFQVIINQICNP